MFTYQNDVMSPVEGDDIKKSISIPRSKKEESVLTMKKALALILAVCMLFSCAVMVSAADAQSVTGTFDSGVFDSTPSYYQARLVVDSGVIDSGDVVTATMTLTEDSDTPRVQSNDFDHWAHDTIIMMQGNVADVDEQVTVAVSINNSKYALTKPIFEKNVIRIDLVKSDNQIGRAHV